MMKAPGFLLILLTAIYFNAYSQHDTVGKGYFYGRGSVGLLVGNLSSGSIRLSSGYHFRFGLEAGIGMGFETFYDRYTPLFTELRYNFGKKQTQPFVGIMGGALIQLNQNYVNSAVGTFGVQIGMTHFFSKHIGLSTSVGYRYADLNQGIYYLYPHFAPEPYTISNHRAELRIGLMLK